MYSLCKTADKLNVGWGTYR